MKSGSQGCEWVWQQIFPSSMDLTGNIQIRQQTQKVVIHKQLRIRPYDQRKSKGIYRNRM